MAKGRPGADSTTQVNESIDGENIIDQAINLFGEVPLFWGRYFKSLRRLSDYEYIHRDESPLLAARRIRVLPIAQQTPNVGGTEQQGGLDAQGNVEDFIASFNADYLAQQGTEFLMFLDVEPSHPLSEDYYLGWAQAVLSHSLSLSNDRFRVVPAVYLNRHDPTTWRALVRAVDDGGAICGGVWVASYGNPPRPGCTSLIEWDNDAVQPPNLTLPFKVLIWQYTEECHGGDGFDCNETNPNIDLDGDLLSKLIIPEG
jgi:hypothetical protein